MPFVVVPIWVDVITELAKELLVADAVVPHPQINESFTEMLTPATGMRHPAAELLLNCTGPVQVVVK